MAITERCNMCCFNLYSINIFTKSTKAERCRVILRWHFIVYLLLFMFFFKIWSSCYFILYSTTLGAKQTYGTSVWLVFPDVGSIWTALIELGVLLIPAHWKKTWKLDKWPQYFHLFVWLLLFLTHSLFYLKIV